MSFEGKSSFDNPGGLPHEIGIRAELAIAPDISTGSLKSFFPSSLKGLWHYVFLYSPLDTFRQFCLHPLTFHSNTFAQKPPSKVHPKISFQVNVPSSVCTFSRL